jgi:hypothetical protein
LIGKAGAHASDILLQLAGLGAFTLPVLLFALGWKWLRSEAIEAQWVKADRSTRWCSAPARRSRLGPNGGRSAERCRQGWRWSGRVLADYLAVPLPNTTGAG